MLLAWALYSNTLGHDFLFDDLPLILQDPAVTSLDWYGVLFGGGYRPVRTVTYLFNYSLGGTDPWGYHLFNIILHGLNAGLVFLLIKNLSGNWAALFGSLIFAAHPVQTAAVAYVSGRKDLLATFFILAGLLLYFRWERRKTKSYLFPILMTVSFFLAVFSKEVAIVAPVLLLLIGWVRRREKGESPNLDSLLRILRLRAGVLIAAALVAISGAIWTVAVQHASRMQGYWGGTFETNLGTSFKLFAHYFSLVFYPHPLLADYSGDVFAVSTGLLEGETLLALSFTLLYIVGAIYLYRRIPVIGLGLLWFFVALLPVLQLIPFHELAADHFLYLPLAGIAISFGRLAFSLWEQPKLRPVLGSVLVIFLSVFSVLTWNRNQDWQSRQTLWEATLEQAPNSARANADLGELYWSQGRVEEGIRLTERSIELNPSDPTGWNNLGTIYFRQSQQLRSQDRLEQAKSFLDQAERRYRQARKLDPADPFVVANLANVFKERALIADRRGQEEQALQARLKAVSLYETALNMPDRRKEVQLNWFNFGGMLYDGGYYDHAVAALRNGLKAFPDYPAGNFMMGSSHYRLGNTEKAIPYLEKAVAGDSSRVEAWDLLSKALERQGQVARAIRVLENALQYVPRQAEVHYNLGVLNYSIGNQQQGISHLEQVLRLEPRSELAAQAERLLEEAHVPRP